MVILFPNLSNCYRQECKFTEDCFKENGYSDSGDDDDDDNYDTNLWWCIYAEIECKDGICQGLPPCAHTQKCLNKERKCIDIQCEEDLECDDDIFCNGKEKCIQNICKIGNDSCLHEFGSLCNEEEKKCFNYDGDDIQIVNSAMNHSNHSNDNPLNSVWAQILLIVACVLALVLVAGLCACSFLRPPIVVAINNTGNKPNVNYNDDDDDYNNGDDDFSTQYNTKYYSSKNTQQYQNTTKYRKGMGSLTDKVYKM